MTDVSLHHVDGIVEDIIDRQSDCAVNGFDAGGGCAGLFGGQQLECVERHGDVAGENLQELQIAFAEGPRFGTFDIQRARHAIVQA